LRGDDRNQGNSQDQFLGEEPLRLEDVNACRLTRIDLSKWMKEPFFDDAVSDFYVRIVSPGASQSSRTQYIVGKICAVQHGEPYDFLRGKTTCRLLLERGDKLRPFKMSFVSNSDITQAEFDSYKQVVEKAGIPLPTTEELRDKAAEKTKYYHYQYNEEAVTKMLEKKQHQKKRPVNIPAERTRLEMELSYFKTEGAADLMQKVQDKLQNLEDYEREVEAERKKNTRENRLLIINQRAKEDNKSISKVIQQTRKELGLQQLTGNTSEIMDPFSRRPTAPTIFLGGPEAKKKEEQEEQKPQIIQAVSAVKTAAFVLEESHNYFDFDDINLDNLPDAPIPIPVAPTVPRSTATQGVSDISAAYSKSTLHRSDSKPLSQASGTN